MTHNPNHCHNKAPQEFAKLSTAPGFAKRLREMFAKATNVPEETAKQMSRGDEVAPIDFACPICEQPITMTRFAIADCEPCSGRLFLFQTRTDRRPAFTVVIATKDEDRPDGEYYYAEAGIHWDADSTSFVVQIFEGCQWTNSSHDDELATLPEIMRPADAKKKLQEIIAESGEAGWHEITS